jgi:hypothetical protein
MDQWGNVLRQVGGAKQNSPLVTINGEALRNPGDTTRPDDDGNFVRLMPDGSLQADVVKDSPAYYKKIENEQNLKKWQQDYDKRDKAIQKQYEDRSMGSWQKMSSANLALGIMERTRGDWIKPEGAGSYLTFLRGFNDNQAQNLAGYIDSILANIGMDNLKALREASETGASGLGQVTEKEHYLLQIMAGYLNKAQTEEHLVYALVAIPLLQKAIAEGEYYDRNGQFSYEIRDRRTAQIMEIAEAQAIRITGKSPLRGAPLDKTPSGGDPRDAITPDGVRKSRVNEILKELEERGQ